MSNFFQEFFPLVNIGISKLFQDDQFALDFLSDNINFDLLFI